MAFNPSPQVAAARDYAQRFDDKEMVIILAIKGDRLEMATYGKNKMLCDEAKRLGDIAFDAIVGLWCRK